MAKNTITTTKGPVVIEDKPKDVIITEDVKEDAKNEILPEITESENNSSDDAEVIETSKPVNIPPVIVEDRSKLVTIIPLFSGEKFIAGAWYKFEEGKEIKVPLFVKESLREKNKIHL